MGCPTEPGGGVGNDGLLVGQLAKISIGLKDPRALASLNAFPELEDGAL